MPGSLPTSLPRRGHFRLWLGCALSSAVLLGFLWLKWPRWQPIEKYQPIPVAREFLRLKDGRLFREGQSTPFTGLMIDLYPDGKRQSRSEIVDGRLHGFSEGWLPDGTLQVREYFQAGVSHGTRTKWHPNGTKLSEANIVLGKIEGTFKQWHENGALAQQIEMRDSQPDGWSRAYYSSGFLKAQALMKVGKLINQKSWPDGETKTADDKTSESE